MDFLVDIGRVLLDFDPTPAVAALLPPGTPDPIGILTRIAARKDEFETGSIDAAEFTDWALATIGSDASPAAFHHAWRHIFRPIPPMWDLVHRLADDGHRLILFSNTNSLHVPWVYENYDIFSRFAGAVLSYEVGCMKPHDGIYLHAIQAWQLDPAATIYIDDLPENIAAGRRHGFRTWQYDHQNHPAFESWLTTELAHGHAGQ